MPLEVAHRTVIQGWVTFLVLMSCLSSCLELDCLGQDSSSKATDAKSATDSNTQQVIADGYGVSDEEATKNAIQAAVQQVVGAVVETQTIVENDELIQDKIITYASGFVTKVEQLPVSKKNDKGIFHVRIKATVERKKLIEKLRAANVAVSTVDGVSIFAEVLSKGQEEKDSRALLREAFADYPTNVFKAIVDAKPKISEQSDDKATLEFTVRFGVDQNAYKLFQQRLNEILSKIAIAKGDFTAKFGPTTQSNTVVSVVGSGGWAKQLSDPIRKNGKPGLLAIAIATNQTKAKDSVSFKYYHLDPLFLNEIISIVSQEMKIRVSLFDSSEELIVANEFKEPPGTLNNIVYGTSRTGMPIMNENGLLGLIVVPGSLSLEESSARPPIFYWNESLYIEKVTLSLEEIKSIKDVKVELSFESIPSLRYRNSR